MLYISKFGYELFRSHIHKNCITGFIHTMFMPIATSGFFMVSASIFCLIFGNKFLNYDKIFNIIIYSLFLAGYLRFDPLWGTITIIHYIIAVHIIQKTIFKLLVRFLKIETNNDNLYFFLKYYASVGIGMIAISVFSMEFIGHWMIEHQGSDIYHFFNSVFHTPLYTVKSLYYPFVGLCN